MSLTAQEATSLDTALKSLRGFGVLSLYFKRPPKDVVDGVQFVTEPVGDMVDVQSFGVQDPGGAAQLVSVSERGARVKYTISKLAAVVEPARVRNASNRMMAPAAAGTRSATSASATTTAAPSAVVDPALLDELTKLRKLVAKMTAAATKTETENVAAAATAVAASSQADADRAKAAADHGAALASVTTERNTARADLSRCADMCDELGTANAELTRRLFEWMNMPAANASNRDAARAKAAADHAALALVTTERDTALVKVERMTVESLTTAATNAEISKQLEAANSQLEAANSQLAVQRVEHNAEISKQLEAANSQLARQRVDNGIELEAASDAAASALTEQLNKQRISGLLAILCPGQSCKIASVDALVTSAAVLNKDNSRRKAFVQITVELLDGMMHFLAPTHDRLEVLRHGVANHPKFAALFAPQTDGGYQKRLALQYKTVHERVVLAWRAGYALHNYRLQKQMLSLLATGRGLGLFYREIQALCSEKRELKEGDPCRVLVASRNNWCDGVISSVGKTTVDAEPPIGPGIKRSRKEIVECILAIAHSKVRHRDDAYCSVGSLKVAKQHAFAHFAGAFASAIRNSLPRTVERKAELWAEFMRSEATVARADTGTVAKRGVKYLLKDVPAKLLAALNVLMNEANLGNVDKTHFYALIAQS